MESTKALALLADLFEVDGDAISPEMNLRQRPLQWDSLTQLGLVAIFKTHGNKVLSPADLRSFQTVQDILDRLND